MTVRFEDVFRELPSCVNKELSLHGRVIVADQDKAYIASSYDAFKHGEYLLIDDDKQIAISLSCTIPPFGGGDCVYDEDIVVTGFIRQTGSSYRLADIRACEIRRDDIRVPIQHVPKVSSTDNLSGLSDLPTRRVDCGIDEDSVT